MVKNVNKIAVRSAAQKSTIDSANIERRVVPKGYVRTPSAERFLAESASKRSGAQHRL